MKSTLKIETNVQTILEQDLVSMYILIEIVVKVVTLTDFQAKALDSYYIIKTLTNLLFIIIIRF